MKKYICVLVLIPTLAFAEPEVLNFQSYCDTTEKIVKVLRDRFDEVPFVTGIADDLASSSMSVWVNPNTGTWSILSTKNEFSCVIGTGVKFKLFPYNKPNT